MAVPCLAILQAASQIGGHVKIVGHGALKGLDGLQSMNRQGPFMKDLNAHGTAGADYYAISANYEPRDPGLKGLVRPAP